MPMGLKNAPARFQRMLTELLRHLPDAAPYMDDILVATCGCSLQAAILQHERDLRFEVLCAQNRLHAERSKCKLFRLEVEYCGHILSGGVRKASPSKLLVVEKWPPDYCAASSRIFRAVWFLQPVCA